MNWLYLALVIGVLGPIPLFLYGTGRLKPGVGEWVGLVLFVTIEFSWYALAQAHGSILYDVRRVLPVQLLRVYPEEVLLMALAYLNCVA
ncbi:MAG: hypothetical protein Q8O40_08340, partial [Chloroflexota bacterium]|nr:hypothetical protein [Chloroflexota bacterium]